MAAKVKYDSGKRQILLIDGGTTYRRLIDRLNVQFDLVHVQNPTQGLEYAENNCSLEGVIVDLVQSQRPSPIAKPSLLGLWIVDQIREFASCSDLPILVIAHWEPEVIEKAAMDAGIEFGDSNYHYIQMSQVESILEFFNIDRRE